MFIRATRTHTDKDGAPVRSHRLVLSQRIGDKVRQRTLLNLGTDYPVPKKKWREVAGLAEALLHGRPPLLEAAPDVQAAAEDIVAKLRARGFRAEAMREEARKPEVATVDLDTLEHENPRTVGCERMCLKALDDLGFADILHGVGIKGREGRIATALIIARIPPASATPAAGCATTVRPPSFFTWKARRSRARRSTVSVTCSGATAPRSSASCSAVNARCSTFPTPSPSTTSPTFTTTATRTASFPGSGAPNRSAMTVR